MTTCSDQSLRQRGQRPQRRSAARTHHAPVVGPLLATTLLQAVAITLAVVFGLPLFAVVAIAVGLAVLTGVASRRTLGSLLAGAGLRVAQPYEPGEQIRVFVPALNSVQDAEIVRVGPANTTLMTASGIVLVPNADMLRRGASS